MPSVAARAAVWRDRLTTRKYSEAAAGLAEPGFSVRLEHGNHGAYFPLGTRNENAAAALAAALAAELEQTGWVGFCAKHPREFAAAVCGVRASSRKSAAPSSGAVPGLPSMSRTLS